MNASLSAIAPTGLRRLLPATIFAAAVTATIVTAPPANATMIESQCKGLNGRYTYQVQGNHLVETCCYESLNPAVPGKTCDNYVDGEYVNTTDYGALPPPESRTPTPTRPQPPGAVNPGPPVNAGG